MSLQAKRGNRELCKLTLYSMRLPRFARNDIFIIAPNQIYHTKAIFHRLLNKS